MRKKISLFVLVAALALWCVGQIYAQAPAQNPPANTAADANVSIVAGPIVQAATDHWARLAWETAQPANTILKYGTDQNNLSQTAGQPSGQQTNYADLANLQPATTYYLDVQTSTGRDLARGQLRTLQQGQAQNAGVQITHGPLVEQVSPNSVVIAWTTDRPSSSVVMYGTDPNNLTQRAEAPWGQTTHRVTVQSLQPKTGYYFQVQSGQAEGTGQTVQSQPFGVLTAPPGQSAMKFNTQ